jgi:hypothetical protein
VIEYVLPILLRRIMFSAPALGIGAGTTVLPESTAFDSTAFSISLWFRAASFPVQAGMLISKGQNNFEIHTAAEEFTGPSAMKLLPVFTIQEPKFAFT